MRRAPAFWQRDGLLPRLLSPVGALVGGVTALRLRREGWYCPIPVICVGNATVGGAGKTTVALDLARRLAAQGWAVHVLLRGYGRSSRGLRWVEPGDPVQEAGDEALLHAAVAPTWTCADRRLGAQAAVAACAEVLLLDDGLQNPGVQKNLSLLVIDGATGFGNGRVLPAGPLREPVAAAAARCQAAVLIGPDATNALARLPPSLPVLRARLEPSPEAAALAGRRVVGFAGIALPDKFFATLEGIGAEIVGRRPFPDHHAYTEAELNHLLNETERLNALPVTTAKDMVRLPRHVQERVEVLRVELLWEDTSQPQQLLGETLGRRGGGAAVSRSI
ncbi:MAG TPA: tetraacyldisaccharide 4'-kinase [Acetobacteraceae bacterium]|jgi:tetraacyldisaccharide 4'-kinase